MSELNSAYWYRKFRNSLNEKELKILKGYELDILYLLMLDCGKMCEYCTLKNLCFSIRKNGGVDD